MRVDLPSITVMLEDLRDNLAEWKTHRAELRNTVLREKKRKLSQWHPKFVIFPRKIVAEDQEAIKKSSYIFCGTVMRKGTVKLLYRENTLGLRAGDLKRIKIKGWEYKDPQDHLADALKGREEHATEVSEAVSKKMANETIRGLYKILHGNDI